MRLVPHERSLVQHYQSKPFALLGVNYRDSKEAAKGAGTNWRSWFDPDGQIVSAYQVTGFPSVFLLDGKGVIRFHSLGAPAPELLDKMVESLVRESEAETSKNPS